MFSWILSLLLSGLRRTARTAAEKGPKRPSEPHYVDLFVTQLEERRVLNAAFSLDADLLKLDQFTQANDENLSISENGSNYVFELSEGTWSGVDQPGVVGDGGHVLLVDKALANGLTRGILVNDSADIDVDVVLSDADGSGADFSGMTGTLELDGVGSVGCHGPSLQFNTLDIQAAHDVDLSSLDALGDLTVAAGGDITLDLVASGGDVTLDSAHDIDLVSLDASGHLTATAGGGITGRAHSDGEMYLVAGAVELWEASTDAPGDLTVVAVGNITLHHADSGGDVFLNAGNDINLVSLGASGRLTATADGEITGRAHSNGDMYLAADSGVELWEATTNGGTLWIDADSDGDGDGVFSLSDEGYGGIDTTGPGGGGVSITAASNMIAVDTLVLDAATSIGSTNSVMLDTNHVSAELTSESGGGPINLTETDSTSVSNFDAGQGTVTLGGGAFLVTDSTADQSTIHVNSGAALGGRGVVGGPVDVDSGGTVAPGLSPGILGTGSIAFDAGSMFQVELNGNTPGPGAGGYDQRHSCIRDSYDGSPKPSFGAQKQRKDRAVGLHRR